MIKRYCDKCKKEIESIEEINHITFSNHIYRFPEQEVYELCNKCYREEKDRYK